MKNLFKEEQCWLVEVTGKDHCEQCKGWGTAGVFKEGSGGQSCRTFLAILGLRIILSVKWGATAGF